MNDEKIILTTVNEVINFFINTHGLNLYRGHGCCTWKLLPALFRHDEISAKNIEKYDVNLEKDKNNYCAKSLRTEGITDLKGISLRMIEIRALKTFLRNISSAGLPLPPKALDFAYKDRSFLEDKGNYIQTDELWDIWPDEEMLDYLALAQHYSLPTSLLDWSYNPFVAIFLQHLIIAQSPIKKKMNLCLSGCLTMMDFYPEKKCLVPIQIGIIIQMTILLS